MEKSKEEKKRIRRTMNDLEKTIMNATKEIVEENGFENVKILTLLQKAKIEPSVFYNRYNDIPELLDKYVRAYDYWFNDSVSINPAKSTPENDYSNMLNGLLDSLYKNASMQKILAWEVSNNNYVTRRTAKNREMNSQPLIDSVAENYKDPDLDIRVVSALLISGIYYLCMHKDISTFCNVNFGTKDGVKKLKKNINELVKRIYQKQPDKK